MEILRQSCQSCGSKTMTNIIARAVGESDKVFVQCATCKEFVARYTIAPQGYYYHGKGFDSFLQTLARSGYVESTKDLQGAFKNLKEICIKEFDEIIEKETRKENKSSETYE